MKHLSFLISAFIIIIYLNSCQGNIEFIPPNFPEKLCIVGIIDADDTTRSIIIEKSFQLEYPGEYSDSIRDLSLTITSGNNLVYDFNSDISLPRKFRLVIPDSLVFTPGEKYSFWAREKNTEEISSEIIVPETPEEFSAQYIGKSLTILPFPYDCHSPLYSAILNLSFTAEKDSYYYIVIDGLYGISTRINFECNVKYSIIESNSPSFSAVIPDPNKFRYEYNSCYILEYLSHLHPLEYSANFFDGNMISEKTCNLKIKIDMDQENFNYKMPITIKLNSIPKDLYLFEKSLYTYRNTQNDPFSEPTYLDGNISGGNGIFAISSSNAISLTLPWESILN